MVSYRYRIQNKTNHTQATQSDWTGSKTKTTCVSLVSRTPSGLFDHHSATCARSVIYQGKISSPHRRAEATGHLQLKVKCSCCGHAKWVVFSKSKPFLPTFGVLLRAKTAKLFLVGQRIFRLSARSTVTHADRCLPTRARNGSPSASGRAGQGGTTGGGGGSLATRVVT